eukprot:5585375-Pyramimonas_sp.AAC.1
MRIESFYTAGMAPAQHKVWYTHRGDSIKHEYLMALLQSVDGVGVPHPPSATVADYNRLLGESTKEGAMRTRGAKTIGRIQDTGDD